MSLNLYFGKLVNLREFFLLRKFLDALLRI